MITLNNIRIFFTALAFLIIFAGSGCSYVSDMAEGAITKRSGFSISAEYDRITKMVTLSWDELDFSDNFAGYEVYITGEKDDEYVGYDLVASRYFNDNLSNLSASSANSYVHDVAGIFAGTELDGPGRYFYRIGIIHWDDNPSKRTGAKGYMVDSSGVALDNDVNYYAKTNIKKISGYKPVDID